MLYEHLFFMAMQLVDSSLPSTREWWRRRIGIREAFVTDPRSIAEILADLRLKGDGAGIFAAREAGE